MSARRLAIRTLTPGAGGAGVPPAAAWLGGLGAVPFVALAVGGPLVEGPWRAGAGFALAAYGAVILSFLGGVRWGLGIVAEGGARPLWTRLCLSVAPSLAGWAALLLPAGAGLGLLAAGFAAMLALDLGEIARGEAPSWYPSLRVPLTIVVVAALVAGALWAPAG